MGSSKLSRFSITPFTGGLNTIAEDGGLISYKNKQGLGVELREQENLKPLRRGGLTVSDGFTNTITLPAAVTGLHEYRKSNGTVKTLATAADKLYEITDSAFTQVATGLSSGAYTQMTTALDDCLIADGVNKLWEWDGTTLAAISATPTGVRASVFYQNRVWLFRADADTSLLYYSDVSSTTAGYGSNFVPCSVSDGQAITAISPYFVPNTLEPIIVVAKERSVGIVTGDGSTANPYTYLTVNQDSGVPGWRQIVQFGQDIAYLTPKGVSSYKTDTVSGDLTMFYMTEKIRDQFYDLNESKMHLSIAWHDWKESRICFAVPENAQDYPNVIYCYDTELKCWYKERYGGKFITALTVMKDGTVYHGDESGKVYKHDGTKSFDGSGIWHELKTDHIHFGEFIKKKRLVELKLRVRGIAQYPFWVQLFYDYGNRTGQLYRVEVQPAKYTWGGGVWTDDPNVYRWATSEIISLKLYPASWFETIQIKVFVEDNTALGATGVNQPLDFFNFEGIVQYGGVA